MKILLSALGIAALVGLGAAFRQPSATPSPTSAPATFEVDLGHSTVLFDSLHLGVSRAYGRFNEFSGKVVFDEGDLARSSIELAVKAASVDSNSPNRDEHLRSPDFFSAKEYPEITFESTKITGTKEALVVEGELSFHGQTRPVTAKAHVVGAGETPFGDYRAGFVAELTVDMADFDVAFVEKNPGSVGPEVHLTVSLECIRK